MGISDGSRRLAEVSLEVMQVCSTVLPYGLQDSLPILVISFVIVLQQHQLRSISA